MRFGRGFGRGFGSSDEGWERAGFAGRGRGEGGGRARGRVFGHGDIRLVLLELLIEKSAHGYELIKAVEEKLRGAYTPSPGLVYPTLTLLEELGMVFSEEGEGGKKRFHATEQGKQFLAAQKIRLDEIHSRMHHAAHIHMRGELPEIVNAMEKLKLALRSKCQGAELSKEQVQQMANALDDAARKIEDC